MAADPLSEAALRGAALRYLARYAATAEQVTRVLMRRVARHGDGDPDTAAAAAARIADIVASLARSGLLDDAGYAAMKAESLHRRGASTRQIRGVLREKGVPGELADDALATLDATHGEDRERRSALRHAQRRGLGPWARPERRAERRLKDIAALARAGFAPGLAARVVDMERAEAEELLTGQAAAPETGR
jgi:regulatory protein